MKKISILVIFLLLSLAPLCVAAERPANVLRFSKSAVPKAAPPMDAAKPGYEIVEQNGREMIRMDGVLHETRPFSGRVVDTDGNPVVGATGTISAENRVAYSVTTDENGAWSAGPFPVYLPHPGVTFEHPDFVKFKGYPTFNHYSITRMTRGNRISGTITDPAGKPLPNVAVFIRRSSPGLETTLMTDAHGRYSLGSLPPANYAVIPKAEGMAFCGEYVTVRRDDKTVDFTMTPARTITIRFVGEDGKPFHDGAVRPAQWRERTSVDNDILYYAEGLEMDDDGVWTWHNAPPGEIRFHVGWKYNHTYLHFLDEKKIYRPESSVASVYAVSDMLTAPPEESEFTVKMVAADPPPLREWESDAHLYLPEKLELTLVDQDGKPVAGAEVKAKVALFTPDWMTEFVYSKMYEGTIRSDAAGKCVIDFSSFKRNQIIMFSMHINAGEDYVRTLADWRDQSLALRGSHEEEKRPDYHIPEQWTVMMPRCNRTASGTIVDEQGNALPGVWVSLSAPRYVSYNESLEPYYRSDPSLFVKTDADGKWRLPKFYSGQGAPYLTYIHPDYARQMDNENPQLRVMKKGGGESRLAVYVRDEEGHPLYGPGEYIGGVSAGNYHLSLEYTERENAEIEAEVIVMKMGYTPVRMTHVIRPGSDWVDVTLKRGKPLRIRAVYPDGKPVISLSNVHMDLTWPENNNRSLGRTLYFEFDRDGVFVWENAPDIEADYRFNLGGTMSDTTQEKTYRMRPREEEYIITVQPGRWGTRE